MKVTLVIVDSKSEQFHFAIFKLHYMFMLDYIFREGQWPLSKVGEPPKEAMALSNDD